MTYITHDLLLPLPQAKDGEGISQADLDALLDRSALIREYEENQQARKGEHADIA